MLANASPIGNSGGLSNTTRQPGARTATARWNAMPRRPRSVPLCMFEPYAKYHIDRGADRIEARGRRRQLRL